MMKILTPVLLLFLFIPSLLLCQKQIQISFTGAMVDTMKRRGPIKMKEFESWKWTINGKTFGVSHDTISINMHKNGFDTIIFERPDKSARIILTKFQPNHHYQIFHNECCSSFDIEDVKIFEKGRKIADEEKRFEFWQKRKNGMAQFEVLNCSGQEMLKGFLGITGWYTGGVLLLPNEKTAFISPFRMGYDTHIFKIGVATVVPVNKEDLDYDKMNILSRDKPFEEYHEVVQMLTSVEYRFFNKEKLKVMYDCNTNSMQILR